MNHPTDPLDHPAGHSGGNNSGTGHRPPAGYFTAPSTDTTAEPAAGTETPAAKEPSAVPGAVRHPARVGTIVWGAVVLVAGILVILSSQLDLRLDAGLTVMWLLLGAGVAMVAGGAANLLRKRQN
ncbi:hypothetical protein ART_2152 [Arthrobacter sp. PAMC 25486]|uniref:hypothetical protein n=1 Tax=Arthrobacter sp. PAMC 25486 TaxID=1494608 RepID=UPI00053628B8|nr:hypothetical protein [Arthrobacter sp. PAMC 25486]AIY01751.1 hypothetical protein ART_2152 [Arthrobacter sp. PAMC 25486]